MRVRAIREIKITNVPIISLDRMVDALRLSTLHLNWYISNFHLPKLNAEFNEKYFLAR